MNLLNNYVINFLNVYCVSWNNTALNEHKFQLKGEKN